MIEDVVQDIQYQQCLTNQEILKNKLYLSAQHPEMAGILTGSVEGHYGRVMGEVLYVIQCPAVPVLPHSSDKCYQEIPVFVNGKRRFLKPLTRIIVAVPTLVDCIPTLTVRFKAHEKWWMRTPTILQAQTPRILDPSISNYQMAPKFIFDVGHKGLYTEAELDALQLEMFFPFKRQAQQNHQARVLFSDGSSQGSYLNLLSPADMTSLSKTIGGKISWFFRIFGKWAATIIGVVVVLKIIVWFVETLINYCTLKKSGKSE